MLKNKTTLALTRKSGQSIILELPNSDYLIIRYEPLPDSNILNCGIYWPEPPQVNYEDNLLRYQEGVQIGIGRSLTVEVRVMKDFGQQVRIGLSAPTSVVITRWEILRKRNPDLVARIRSELPHLRLRW